MLRFAVMNVGYCTSTIAICDTPRDALEIWAKHFVRSHRSADQSIVVEQLECDARGEVLNTHPLPLKTMPPEVMARVLKAARHHERLCRFVSFWRSQRAHVYGPPDATSDCCYQCPCASATAQRNEEKAAAQRAADRACKIALELNGEAET